MEAISETERNRRIIALSQFVSSFFVTEEDVKEADSLINSDAFIANDDTSPFQDELFDH